MSAKARACIAAALLGVYACASAVRAPSGDIDATMSRGGGIAGLSETVHVWSVGGNPQGIYARSDRPGSRAIQLAEGTFDSSLAVLQSLIGTVPRIPPDTGAVRHVCADVILLHIEVREAGRARSAEEECPHRSVESEQFWQRVDSLFKLFVASAHHGA